jgi:hypothetical protein
MMDVLPHLPWATAAALAGLLVLALALRQWGGPGAARAGGVLIGLALLAALAWVGIALLDAMRMIGG